MAEKRPDIIGPGGVNPFKDFKMPGKMGIVGIVLALLVVGGFVILQSCFTYIHPNEVGIKQVNIGTSRGIQKKVYSPGLAFVVPFGFEQIHRFPQHVQVLDLTDNPTGIGLPSYSSDKAAKIQTSDGFYVDVDVSILYKIVDPYLLITTLGPGKQYLHQGIRPKAEPMLKQALGELTTEDFYNSPLRVSKAQKARDLLDVEMRPKGIQVDHVFVRYFRYSPQIQKNIEEKKLQDQLVFKNQAEARAATEEAIVKRIREEGDARVQVTLEGGSAYKVTKNAEKELYARTKHAEGDLLVQLAEAKKTELRNEAMQARGAEKAVAMKMADVLNGLDVIIVHSGGAGGINPLDLDQMVDMFGAVPDGAGAPRATIAPSAKTQRAGPERSAEREEVAR